MDRSDLIASARPVRLAGTNTLGAPARPAAPSCASCESTLVYPVGWERREGDAWLVDVRCPQCEEVREHCLERSDVDRLDEEFDAGLRTLVEDLKLLERGNMEQDVERFVAALNAGHILPVDF